MKRILFIALLSTSVLSAVAQIEVEFTHAATIWEVPSKEDVEIMLSDLSKTTTVFVCKETDNIVEFKQAMQNAWTLSNFVVIPYSKLNDYMDNPEYSLLLLATDGYVSSTGVSSTWIVLELLFFHERNKNRGYYPFASARMYCSNYGTYHNAKKNTYKSTRDFYYGDAHFTDWQPGFIQCYLGAINNYVSKREEIHSAKGTEYEKEDLRMLKSETLYIPQSLVDAFKITMEGKNGNDLFEKYEFKYSVVPDTALSIMILDSNNPMYILMSGPFISSTPGLLVLENISGNIFYQRSFGSTPSRRKNIGFFSSDIAKL